MRWKTKRACIRAVRDNYEKHPDINALFFKTLRAMKVSEEDIQCIENKAYRKSYRKKATVKFTNKKV